MTSINLKACPFCASANVQEQNDVVLSSDGGEGYSEWIECANCGGRARCAEAWNLRSNTAVNWRPVAEAPQDGTRLLLWDSVSKRPVFGSWRGDNPKITHYAAEPAGPEVA
ncbi:Lar family restriction alleviation protein [Stenotrophomonas maltophilia]